jgi:hypothetical protein
MKMKTVLSLVAAAVALVAQGAFAQTPAPEKSRAEVKEEAKAAVKTGQTKAGEGAPTEKAAAKSDKARADVKAETKKAVKEGTTLPAGEATQKK